MATDGPTGGGRRVDDAAGRPVYYDDCAGTYHSWVDDAVCEPVSTTLLLVVSSIQGVDPLELDDLTAAVDPDALESLFDHWQAGTESGATVSFTFAQCTVTVHDTGELVVEPVERSSGDDHAAPT
ncbi:HalOD1 output domain-containing protein [Natronobeatus ordinarius]|uniref:HalOD1 output domain-containing protein n=1 Tax=Natronobeatus ordinarius TaxID=2963433 RepID=UPI0020CFDA55|nr:HalOD1 output domain-containing protein [Natronobeatus ordinarius]